MNLAAGILTAAYAAALGGLLHVARGEKRHYAAAKGLCSGLFLLCAVLAGFYGGQWGSHRFALLLAALALCAFGDVFLGIANQKATRPSRRPFLAGVASFTLAHLIFCLLFYEILPLRWYDPVLPAMLLLALFVLERRGRVRLKKMRFPAYIYTFLMALMVSKALQLPSGFGTFALPMRAGAVLFMVSDIILLFLYFGVRRRACLRFANLLTYYLGIYLIAAGARWL